VEIVNVNYSNCLVKVQIMWVQDSGFSPQSSFNFRSTSQGVHCSSTVNIHVRAQKGYYLEQACTNVRARDILLLSKK
jgi:hypothetical protein